ncbi:hypothetical protein [Homoserinibacter sp. GY 40078]|uniref:hypothetical protein n=1 Tax=Homoserinibacter sp. GY 40078 TaxID=2603275 RepID=UPI0011CC10CC|nr:hypothetical protein [Homoserinibacter sp. GY 40078]TXK18481.1 hypothetical protein FVQ89_00510 [Homoserinibacter sp. GY 40078]
MSRRRLTPPLARAAVALALATTATGAVGTAANACIESEPLDITDRDDLVSILYSVWFDPVIPETGTPAPPDISDIFATANATQTAPAWGPLGAFHYWSEPDGGYYRSDDRDVIRRHMTQLEAAGVDFIIIDNSNANSTWPTAYYEDIFLDPVAVLLDEMLTMRHEGIDTPHVVFWNRTSPAEADPGFAGKGIRDEFYTPGTYDELFVEWDGKPLMLGTDTTPTALDADFTQRRMWGLQPSLAAGEWSFLQPYPQSVAMNGADPEQLSVATAFQESYMSHPLTATPRRGGITFATEWQRAFDVRPKIVTLTWWNEWIAQRFEDEYGNTRFVDNFTDEYSRDIEPSSGPLGDRYLDYMEGYIAAYKAHDPFPTGLVDESVALGGFETGEEGWVAGTGTASAVSRFGDASASVPNAADGARLLSAESSAVTGETWRSVVRSFEREVDFSQHEVLRVDLDHWGGAPGATDYEARVIVHAADATTRSTTVLSPGGSWQTIELDLSGWTSRSEVTSIEIGFRAVGSTTPWVSKFFVDDIRLDAS